jgi:hypothetical protein
MQAVVGLFSACWAQDGRVVELGGVRGEVLAGVAVVADDRLAAAQRDRGQPAGDVALFVVGAGKDHRAIVPSGAPSMAWATHNVTTPRGARRWRPPARTTSAAVIPAGFWGMRAHTRPGWSPTAAASHAVGAGRHYRDRRSASIVAPTGPHHHAHPHVRRAARARSGGVRGGARSETRRSAGSRARMACIGARAWASALAGPQLSGPRPLVRAGSPTRAPPRRRRREQDAPRSPQR